MDFPEILSTTILPKRFAHSNELPIYGQIINAVLHKLHLHLDSRMDSQPLQHPTKNQNKKRKIYMYIYGKTHPKEREICTPKITRKPFRLLQIIRSHIKEHIIRSYKVVSLPPIARQALPAWPCLCVFVFNIGQSTLLRSNFMTS